MIAAVTGLPAQTAGTAADLVLGQFDFAKNQANLTDGVGLISPSSAAIDAAGHVYVADNGNNRILGWIDAAALTNGQPADLVIGQPDFRSSLCNQGGATASANGLCGPAAVAVDAAGNLYVADSNNNRVLEYDNPRASGGGTPGTAGSAGDATADLIFGQGGDFTATNCNGNASAASADTLCYPGGVAVDSSGDLYIADEGNNRVLEYNNPLAPAGGSPGTPGSAGDTTADLVFGQGGDFTGTNCDGNIGTASADTLCGPSGVAIDGAGNLYVADAGNSRALEYNNPLVPGGGTPGTPGSPGDTTADLVFGQGGDFTGTSCEGSSGTASADTLCSPSGVGIDGAGNVYITDINDSRVLEYGNPLAAGGGTPGTPGSAGDTTADLVFGQSGDFTATNCNGIGGTPSADTLCNPSSASVDAAGNVYVADTGNNRILRYDNPLASGGGSPGTPSSTGDTTADVVLGQFDFAKNQANLTDGAGLIFPEGAAVDAAGHLYVVDTGNNRVLGWSKAAALQNGSPADFVLGQPDLLSYSCNQGAAASASSLCGPTAVAIDGAGNLYVADSGNNRVLEYNNPRARRKSGMPGDTNANLVFGQSGDFTAANCNGSVDSPSADTLCYPAGVTVDGAGNLYIVDGGNNRVLEYDNPVPSGGGTPGTPGSAGDTTADVVFGQGGDFTASYCNGGASAASADTLCGPSGASVDGAGDVYIADSRNSRVLEYNSPLAPGGGNPGTPGSVGDTTADLVFGQNGSFTTGASGGPVGVPIPFGLAMLGLGAAFSISPGRRSLMIALAAASLSVAQVSCGGGGSVLNTSQTTSGGTPSTPIFAPVCNAGADGLCNPTALMVDGAGNLYVADTGNNRVLEYYNPLDPSAGSPGTPGSSGDTTADLVFGQAGDFTSVACANGQYPGPSLSADGLCGPSGVAIDSASNLYIVDSSNNRVLGFVVTRRASGQLLRSRQALVRSPRPLNPAL